MNKNKKPDETTGADCQQCLVRHVWIYDCNRRVYTDPETGESSSSPIYKYGWVKHPIIGETRVSWLCGYDHSPIKIPKKGKRSGVCFSEEEVNQECYVHDNAYKLSEKVRRANYGQLREIERILFLPNAKDVPRAEKKD